MDTKAFDIQEVLKSSWEGFKKAPVLLIVLLLIPFMASVIINIFAQVSYTFFGFLPILTLALLNIAIGSYVMLSTIKAVIMLGNDEIPAWDVLKNDLNTYLRFLAASIILSIIFLISTLLFLIPLLFAAAIFFPVPYIIATRQGLSIIDSFQKSWQITTPQLIPCIIFIIVAFILIILGMLAFGIGVFITAPITYIAGAIIYKKLDAAKTAITN
ncbi:MAG: hypothetical protein FWG57_02895 [Endomicrobia bacterium]|nr:hypothetical protein [Endomicrobiia bacterium]